MKNNNQLPVLTAIVDSVRTIQPLRHQFGHTAILSVQHLLGSTVSLMKSVLELGVKPDFIHLIGKPYSTSPLVVSQLQSLGIHVQGY